MKEKRLYEYYADMWVAFSQNEPALPFGTVSVGYYHDKPGLEECLRYLISTVKKETSHNYSVCNYKIANYLIMLVRDDKNEFIYLTNIRRGGKVKNSK